MDLIEKKSLFFGKMIGSGLCHSSMSSFNCLKSLNFPMLGAWNPEKDLICRWRIFIHYETSMSISTAKLTSISSTGSSPLMN